VYAVAQGLNLANMSNTVIILLFHGAGNAGRGLVCKFRICSADNVILLVTRN